LIRILRGREPDALAPVREQQLAILRALNREPRKDDVRGYEAVAFDLWQAQHFKCCYCEMKVASSGVWRLNSLNTDGTDQTNMPAFQRKFPLRRNDSARSAFGFSRKRMT